jgi:hypothetical protein
VVDQAAISSNHDMILRDNSELKHEMTFEGGVPFEKVIDVLRSVPIGLNPISVSVPR